MPTRPNIHYELTKQRISQSLRVKGAERAYDLLHEFLTAVGEDVKYDEPGLGLYIWVEGKEKANQAKELEKRIIKDYGSPPNPTKITNFFSFSPRYEKSLDWPLKNAEIRQHLRYVDELGPLSGLEPRPPVSVSLSASFWLPNTPHTELMRSTMLAWLSPTSNSVTLGLEFPFESGDSAFKEYRQRLQSKCPVSLEDKYFYIRRGTGPEKYSFKRVYR